MDLNRRDLLQAGLHLSILGMATPLLGAESRDKGKSDSAKSLHDRICLFTDPIDDFDYSYEEVASMLQQLKLSGADLTVRSGGLVPPERVTEELPRISAVFRDHGLSIPMISTNILSTDESTKAIFAAMQQVNIRYYKLGYFHYGELPQWQADIDATRQQLRSLIALGEQAGIVAGVHNHAGATVGTALWDLALLLDGLDEKWVGSYFDPAHATIEGGEYAWKLGFLRLAKRIKMIAIKDFVWEKTEDGWKARWCPLGEGMVRWKEFFSLLKDISFDGPISLHIEYDPGGSTRSERLDRALAAADRDLQFLRRHIDQAYGS